MAHRWTAVAATGALVAAAAGVLATSAQAEHAAGDFSAYSTGAVVHADAVTAVPDGPRLVDAEVAFSGQAVDSHGLTEATVSEVDTVVQPALPGKTGYGQGSGLQAGLGTTPPVDPAANQLILAGLAEADSPPPTDLVTEEVGPVPAAPLAYASLLRGQAAAHTGPDGCAIGQPLAFGLGFAADAQLLDAAEANADGTLGEPVLAVDDAQGDTVSRSRSLSVLVPNGDGTFGLVSETRQSIAPVTLFKGTANEVTIEFLGEWILRVKATGKPGGSSVEYAPQGGITPSTPIVRIIPMGEEAFGLTFQDIFGETGLTLPENPLIDLAIGEDPRAIGGNAESEPTLAADGTVASAAVDVLRIQLLPAAEESGLSTLDVRVGHMEAAANVPPGGIRCGIPVTKDVVPNPVQAGETFQYTITVPSEELTATIACDLVSLRVEDRVEVIEGDVDFTLTGASDGGVVNDGAKTVVWEGLSWNVGDPPLVLTIDAQVADTSGAGRLQDTVNATATTANCTGGAAGEQLVGEFELENVALTGQTVIQEPGVEAGEVLAVTGEGTGLRLLAGVALLGLGALAWHRRRSIFSRT